MRLPEQVQPIPRGFSVVQSGHETAGLAGSDLKRVIPSQFEAGVLGGACQRLCNQLPSFLRGPCLAACGVIV